MSTAEQYYPVVKYDKPTTADARPMAAAERSPWVVRLLWLSAACSVVGMAIFLPFGWDAKCYLAALHGSSSLAYSPLFMMSALSVAKLLPVWMTIALFGLAYFAGFLSQLWVGMQCATEDERRVLRYVAPVIAFFPGLLISDVITSGNIAYILYGMMLASAALGWKRGNWNWFYVAVLAAACVKVHLLTMLAIPLLCGNRQWTRTIVTGAAGLALYAGQARIWPQAFHLYLNSLQAMSLSTRDFGCGPAGNLARVLQVLGMPFQTPSIIFYVAYAIAMFLVLLWLSRLYREHRISFVSWAPVMLLGTVLLNPRILTYDVAAVSLPMALIAWRSLRDNYHVMIGAAVVLLALNIFVSGNSATMLPDEFLQMLLMLGVFAGGVRGLLREAEFELLTSPVCLIESAESEPAL